VLNFAGSVAGPKNLGDKARLLRLNRDHYPIDGAKVFNLANFYNTVLNSCIIARRSKGEVASEMCLPIPPDSPIDDKIL